MFKIINDFKCSENNFIGAMLTLAMPALAHFIFRNETFETQLKTVNFHLFMHPPTTVLVGVNPSLRCFYIFIINPFFRIYSVSIRIYNVFYVF